MRRHRGRNVYGMELVWRKQGQPAVMMQVTDSSVRRARSRGAMKTHSVYASRDAWTRVRWGLGHTHFQTCRETQACVRCTPQQTAQSEGTSLTSVLLHETEEGGRKRGREGGERVCIFVACSCVPLVQTAELCVSAGPINFYVVCDRSTAK